MTVVRIGILGTGTVIRQCHLPALKGNPRAIVEAVGNLKQPSMQSICDKFDVGRAFTDFDRFACDPEIDAVIVALPNYMHAPVTRLILQQGKHVLCEKPMALTAGEAREMVSAAEQAQRTLMIAHVWRCHPEVQWLRQIIASGGLGTIQRVKGHAVVARRGPKPGSWFVRPETSGGGALIDIGIHSIDTISYLLGDRLVPKSVTCRIENRFGDLRVEDTASVRIEYDNGMIAEIGAGWYHDHAESPHGAVEVFGTKGYARTLPAEFKPATGSATAAIERPNASAHPDDNQPVYAAQIDHFLDCILENRQPACDGRQGLRDMEILDAAYESARSGSTVSFASPATLAAEVDDANPLTIGKRG